MFGAAGTSPSSLTASLPALKDARGSPNAAGRSGSFPAHHSSIWVSHASPFKPGFYLYLAWQSVLLGPVSKSLEVFPLMPAGSSLEQMSFSLGSGAAALNLGQTSGLSEQPQLQIKCHLIPAPRTYCTSADTGIAGLAAGQKQRWSDFPLGYRAGGFKILSDEKASPFRNAMR